MERAKILVVDDVADNIALTTMILEDDYEVFAASSGEECLELAPQIQPDVIILDVNMPGMTGYDVCRVLKKLPETAMTPVIFASALDLPEQRLEGFEAGGDEYLVKPLDANMLVQKVQGTLAARLESRELQRRATDAFNAAMEAMTTSSELGSLIQFMKDNSHVNSYETLAEAARQVMRSFGLNGCVMIRANSKQLFFGCEANSLESRILLKSADTQRIFDFGPRSIFSGESIALLVKNMPLDDPSRYGRLKDHLVVLCTIADGRVHSLGLENELKGNRNAIIETLIKVSEKHLENIRAKAKQHDTEIRHIMQDMIGQLEEKLLFLGLDDDQEVALIKLANDTSKRLEKIDPFANEVEASLGEILDGLYQLLSE